MSLSRRVDIDISENGGQDLPQDIIIPTGNANPSTLQVVAAHLWHLIGHGKLMTLEVLYKNKGRAMLWGGKKC